MCLVGGWATGVVVGRMDVGGMVRGVYGSLTGTIACSCSSLFKDIIQKHDTLNGHEVTNQLIDVPVLSHHDWDHPTLLTTNMPFLIRSLHHCLQSHDSSWTMHWIVYVWPEIVGGIVRLRRLDLCLCCLWARSG